MKKKKFKKIREVQVSSETKKGLSLSFFALAAIFSGLLLGCLVKFLPVDIFFVDFKVPNEEVYQLRFNRLFWGIGLTLSTGVLGLFISNALKKNWVLLITTVATTLLVVEMGMMYFTKSDGAGSTIAHLFWYRKFCNNTFKLYEKFVFRDTDAKYEACTLREEPILDSSFCKKKKIYVVGDSFTWGDGIELPQNTFTGVLTAKVSQKYPGEYDIFNLGDRGADAFKEESNLMYFANEYVKKVGCLNLDIVVWQYYLNDIDQISANHGNKIKETPPSCLSKWGEKYMMRKSFLTDYIYWKYFTPKDDTYLNFIKESFMNDSIFHQHLQPIIQVAQKSKQNDIRFVVLLFPVLTDTDFSKQQFKKIIALLQQYNIEYIDMTHDIESLALKDRVVNERNLHPSEKVHKITGDKIFSQLFNK